MRHTINASVVALALTLSAAGAVAAAAAAGSSSTVSATALPSSDAGRMFAHRGSLVHASQLSIRSFVNANDGFALANVGQAQYPASTTNGGRTWRVDGPHFHVNAANAPDVVSGSGAATPNTYFAYGGTGGGNSVVVSTDAGGHWWRAYMPGVPISVVPTYAGGGKAALGAIVETNPGRFVAYVSTDGGRHWHLHHGIV